MKDDVDVTIVTGAAGFLGSAITVALESNYRVIAIDNRIPSSQLRSRTPNAQWIQNDVSDKESIAKSFEKVYRKYGRIDFVLHLAAFWHFGTDYSIGYRKTNDQGTRNIIDLCCIFQCKRLIFTSTLSVLSQVAAGQTLNERSKTKSTIPYARSKISNELMLVEASVHLPVAILRTGAVFSEWCELPPLYSLIRHWSQAGWIGKTILGKGNTGFPYMHRDDFVEVVKKVIVLNNQLDNCEFFLACGSETVVHADLFPLIRKCLGHDDFQDSIHLPVWLVRLVLHFKCITGKLLGKIPYEQPWMMDYVDKPWIVDNSYTQKKLGWRCKSNKDILHYIPQIINNYKNYEELWIERMHRRNNRVYEYEE